jgi:hypothetical protein
MLNRAMKSETGIRKWNMESGGIGMLSALKPNKMNVMCTVLLLIANVVGGMISQSAMQALMIGNGGQFAGRGSFSGQRGQFAQGSGQISTDGSQSGVDTQSGTDVAQAAGFSVLSNMLIRGSVNLVILAILFYVVVSFAAEWFAKGQKAEKARAGSKR